MNKTEIYYKFIFPTYESLSKKTGSQAVTSDGVDQIGEVKALCDACPSRVITYDRLSSTLKSYVDKYVSLPKYFNLRNYWDANPCQEGGVSLIVSRTPENLGSSWTKFTVGSKTIYCSLSISSGDFFYGFSLPDEVLIKSGLLDEITASKFHTNWFITDDVISIRRAVPRAIHFNNSDYIYYSHSPSSHQYIPDPNYPGYPYVSLFGLNSPSPENPLLDHERRVFVQHYFSDHYQYGLQSGDSVSVHGDFNEDLKQDFLGLEATRRILYYYDGVRLKNPDNDNLITITGTGDIPILIDRVDYPSGIPQGYLWWSSEQTDTNTTPIKINTYDDGSWREVIVYTRAFYAQDNCALLRDWSKQITKTLTENINKIGKNTQISYEPPDIYRTDKGGCPPLQIPYNLLRYALNDRPPFSDCETVLVMWVANGDPSTISDSDTNKVKKLHDLGWEQYAIPISVRCCFKDDAYNTDRFLVLYPHGATGEADDEYAYHFRRAAKYNKDLFREALFLQDLIRYSNDYVISFRNTSYSYTSTDGFDIQRHLFTNLKKSASSSPSNAPTAFRELYVRKAYKNSSGNRENQFYYVKVDKKDSSDNYVYDVNTTNTSLSVCLVNPGTATQFNPRNVLTIDKYKDWDLADNDWNIRTDWFIALFDASDVAFSTRSGKLTLVNSAALKSKLISIDNSCSWNDIYLSSFGISPYNQTNRDFLKHANSNVGSMVMLPLDVLDGHIKIGSTTYGSNTSNHLVVVGFKDVFDYTNDDNHHFHYDSTSNSYVLTKNQNNSYTAYVMSSTYRQ